MMPVGDEMRRTVAGAVQSCRFRYQTHAPGKGSVTPKRIVPGGTPHRPWPHDSDLRWSQRDLDGKPQLLPGWNPVALSDSEHLQF